MLGNRLQAMFGPSSWLVLSDTLETGRRWVLGVGHTPGDSSPSGVRAVVAVFDSRGGLSDTATGCLYSPIDPWNSCVVSRTGGRWEFVDQDPDFRDSALGQDDDTYLGSLHHVNTRRLVVGPDRRGGMIRHRDTTLESTGFPDRLVGNRPLYLAREAAVYVVGCQEGSERRGRPDAPPALGLVPTTPEVSDEEDSLGYLTGETFYWTGYRLHGMVGIDCASPLRLVVQPRPGVRIDSVAVERTLAWHFNDDGSGGCWREMDVSQGLPAVKRATPMVVPVHGGVMDLPEVPLDPTPGMVQELLRRMDAEGWSVVDGPTDPSDARPFRFRHHDGRIRQAEILPSEFEITVTGHLPPPYDGDEVVLSNIWGTQEYGD